jgi:hypothetical protein
MADRDADDLVVSGCLSHSDASSEQVCKIRALDVDIARKLDTSYKMW